MARGIFLRVLTIRIATGMRTWIAQRRDNRILSALARYCAKYLRAWENQLQWDVVTNGEAFALRAVTRVVAGDLFDVGANVGGWAVMAAAAAPDRRIHSFELAPRTYARLAERVAGMPQVVINPFGLGDVEEQVVFHYYVDSDDRSSLVLMPDGFTKTEETGSIRTGDSYVTSAGVERIAYLKVDVEGAEMRVLRGFGRSFESGIIAAVQFEHGPAHVYTRTVLLEFVEFFESRGYVVYRLFPRKLLPLRYDPAEENFVGSNFVAIRAEIAREVLAAKH
jgi:FkbM family methyltransferase